MVEAVEMVEMLNGVPVTTVMLSLVILVAGLFLIALVNVLLKRLLKNLKDGLCEFISYSICFLLTLALLAGLLNLLGTGSTPALLLYILTAVMISTAVKHTVENMAAGMFLLFKQPFKKGSHVTANDMSGYVRRYTLAGTTIETDDGLLAIIPNSAVIEKGFIVTENTDPYAVTVSIPARLNADQEFISKALSDAASDIPYLLAEPKPCVQISSIQPGGVVMYNCVLWCEYGFKDEVIDAYYRNVIKALGADGFAFVTGRGIMEGVSHEER